MIEINNLCGGYGKKQVISDINITFAENEITTITGPNGCGKSTLLQCIANQLKAFSGHILISGKNISDYTRNDLAKQISYLPQARNIGSISVRALVSHGRFPYLSYPRKYTAEDIEKVDMALKLAGVDMLADALLCELSGGQQQRVYIAMLLAQDTPIILLDEPVTYLDINYQLELMELIQSLKLLGKTVVMVLHDLELALNYSDRITVMKSGQIAAFNTPCEIAESNIYKDIFNVETVYCKEINRYSFVRG